jgi:uncharacterized membrane protein
MESKKWWLSKTVWAGIITAVVGAAQAIGLQFGFDLMANPIAGVVLTILGVLGVYGRATATTVLKQ